MIDSIWQKSITQNAINLPSITNPSTHLSAIHRDAQAQHLSINNTLTRDLHLSLTGISTSKLLAYSLRLGLSFILLSSVSTSALALGLDDTLNNDTTRNDTTSSDALNHSALIKAAAQTPIQSSESPANTTQATQVTGSSPQFFPGTVSSKLDDKFDWLLISSGELLKGEFIALYDDKLEFDSDELDIVTLDWEDVKVLQSKGVVSIGFTDLTTRSGRLLLQEGKCYLDGVACNRNEIMTIISGQPQESNYWSSKISLGANIRKGNTNEANFSATAKIIRRTTESRFNADYFGNSTRSDGENTANNHRLNSNFDWFLSKQFYLRPVFAEYYKDPFLNIDYKLTLGSGVGYNIIDTAKTELSISTGPAYTFTQFSEVEAGSNDSEGSGTFVVSTNFDTELSSDIDFTAQYRIQYGNKQSGGYTHHALATFEIELTKLFDLDLSFVWDRTNHPRADTEGVVPTKDDYQFIVGFGIDI